MTIYQQLPLGADILVLCLPYLLFSAFEFFRWREQKKAEIFTGSYLAWHVSYLRGARSFAEYMKWGLIVFMVWLPWIYWVFFFPGG